MRADTCRLGGNQQRSGLRFPVSRSFGFFVFSFSDTRISLRFRSHNVLRDGNTPFPPLCTVPCHITSVGKKFSSWSLFFATPLGEMGLTNTQFTTNVRNPKESANTPRLSYIKPKSTLSFAQPHTHTHRLHCSAAWWRPLPYVELSPNRQYDERHTRENQPTHTHTQQKTTKNNKTHRPERTRTRNDTHTHTFVSCRCRLVRARFSRTLVSLPISPPQTEPTT